MHRYFVYIFRQLFGPLLVVTLGLTAVIWLTQSLRFIDLIINKGLSFWLFLNLTLLLMPSLLMVVLPIAVYASVLYVYHRLLVDSEIMVLRATGLSNLQIAGPALAMALLVTGLGYADSLYFMPSGFRAFKDMQAHIRASYASVLIQEGAFNTPVEGLTIYVRERDRSGELRGILVHDNRDPKRPSTVMAASGLLTDGEGGPRFVLRDGNRQEVEIGDGQLSLLYFDNYVFDLGGVAGINNNRFREPKERYLHELLYPRDVVEDRHRREFWAEAQRRLVMPLQNLVFVLFGLAALLSGEFNRRGQGWRLLSAVGLAVAVQAFTLGMTDVIVGASFLTPALYIGVIASGLAAAYVLIAGRIPGLAALSAAVGR